MQLVPEPQTEIAAQEIAESVAQMHQQTYAVEQACAGSDAAAPSLNHLMRGYQSVKYLFSEHAQEQMSDRQITMAEVDDVLQNPQQIVDGE